MINYICPAKYETALAKTVQEVFELANTDPELFWKTLHQIRIGIEDTLEIDCEIPDTCFLCDTTHRELKKVISNFNGGAKYNDNQSIIRFAGSIYYNWNFRFQTGNPFTDNNFEFSTFYQSILDLGTSAKFAGGKTYKQEIIDMRERVAHLR